MHFLLDFSIQLTLFFFVFIDLFEPSPHFDNLKSYDITLDLIGSILSTMCCTTPPYKNDGGVPPSY